MSEQSGSGPPRDEESEAYRQLSRRYAVLSVGSATLIVLLCLMFVVPVPYVTMRPGPVFDTLGEYEGEPMLAFGDDVRTYETSGALDFTTVSISRADARLSLAEAIRGYLTASVDVVPRSFVYGEDETVEQSREQGQAALTSSKDASRVAALRAAGYRVGERPVVGEVLDDGPSAGVLRAGDRLLAVDGRETPTADEVVAAVGAAEPGDEVTVRVGRGGDERRLTLTTEPDPEAPSVPRIGVLVTTRYDFPVDVRNNIGDRVGGPSAGTMFALAIYDRLTPGQLTGGSRIAGTGEITPSGDVRAIGGLEQKLAGAADDDVEIFVLPEANCAETRTSETFGMRLLAVSTLRQAIDGLQRLADDPEAAVPTCP